MHAGMIEHSIQQNPDSPAMRLLHQRRQLILRPEIRINGEIIRRGILMIKVGGEDRGQVQALRAQLLQIRELLPDPRQIAAQIIFTGRPGVPAVQGMPVRMQAASTETFWENLVIDQSTGPFRRAGHVAGIDLQQLKKPLCGSCSEKPCSQ